MMSDANRSCVTDLQSQLESSLILCLYYNIIVKFILFYRFNKNIANVS